jgi:hypothetical protein
MNVLWCLSNPKCSKLELDEKVERQQPGTTLRDMSAVVHSMEKIDQVSV